MGPLSAPATEHLPPLVPLIPVPAAKEPCRLRGALGKIVKTSPLPCINALLLFPLMTEAILNVTFNFSSTLRFAMKIYVKFVF
jgi:hypothetical protein